MCDLLQDNRIYEGGANCFFGEPDENDSADYIGSGCTAAVGVCSVKGKAVERHRVSPWRPADLDLIDATRDA